MKFKIKDPGSAITHFIACVMAVLAAAPIPCTAFKGSKRTG